MINVQQNYRHNIDISQFSPLTAFSSDQGNSLAPYCFNGQEYTPTNSPSPDKRRLQTEQELMSTYKSNHNATSGTGGLSSKIQSIRSKSQKDTKSKKKTDFYNSGSYYFQNYSIFNGSGSILKNQNSIKLSKNQQQQHSIGQQNVFEKRHDVSHAEQESFLQHVEARLHQLQFQLTFKKQKKQKQLSNLGDIGKSNRKQIIQRMTKDSIIQKNINSHNQRNSPLKSSNCMKIDGNIIQHDSQIDMDILENYSFEIERINNLEIPKNVSQPLHKLDVAVVPSKECEMYNQILLQDGRIQFRPDDQKILITTNVNSNFQSSRIQQVQKRQSEAIAKQAFSQAASSISPGKSSLNERAQKKQKQFLQMLQKQRQDTKLNVKEIKSSQYHSHLSKVLQKKVQEAKKIQLQEQNKATSMVKAEQLDFSFAKLQEDQLKNKTDDAKLNKNDISLKLADLNEVEEEEQQQSSQKVQKVIEFKEVFRGDKCQIWDALDCNILRDDLGVKSGEFPLLLPCLQEMKNMDLGLNLCSANFQPVFKAPNEEPPLEFFPFPQQPLLLNR